MENIIQNTDWERLAKLCKILAKVHIQRDNGMPTPCWIYPSGSRGQSRFEGKVIYVHRLVYELWNNITVPENEVIRHLCYQGQCVNPAHVTPGTNGENMTDKVYPPVLAMIERLRGLGYKVEK